MAVTLTQPRQRIGAAAAALVIAGMLAAPVLAAPERGLMCAASTDPAPALSATELSAKPVSSGDDMPQDHLLKPRADAALRSAFADETQESDAGLEADVANTDEAAVAETGLHGTSESKRPVYKRQMYRRDI